MSRIVINLQETWNNQIVFWLQSALGNIQGGGVLYPLNVVGNSVFDQVKQGALQLNAVKMAGELLYQDLATHNAVQQAIQQAQAISQGMAPIYVHAVDGNDAEELPWETLFTPQNEFLALHRRWPIGRMASSTVSFAGNIHQFRSRLRLMAILTAAQVDAIYEWRALHQAISAGPLEVQLRVLVCQDTVKSEIENLGSNLISVDFLPTDLNDLEREIQTFSPNILHFFCHGSTLGGPHLQLASRADWSAGKAHGSVALDASQLLQIPNITQFAWLMTLNCCRGAAPAADISSLARGLVVAGIPAVLGMRETVTSNDANLFCEAAYRAILAEIHTCVNSGAARTGVEWVKLLFEPRRRLAQQHGAGQTLTGAAAATKQWTLPVIYVRPEPFELEIPQPAQLLTPEERLQLQTRLAVLRTYYDDQLAQPNLPPEALAALAEIKAEIDRLEAQLA